MVLDYMLKFLGKTVWIVNIWKQRDWFHHLYGVSKVTIYLSLNYKLEINKITRGIYIVYLQHDEQILFKFSF